MQLACIIQHVGRLVRLAQGRLDGGGQFGGIPFRASLLEGEPLGITQPLVGGASRNQHEAGRNLLPLAIVAEAADVPGNGVQHHGRPGSPDLFAVAYSHAGKGRPHLGDDMSLRHPQEHPAGFRETGGDGGRQRDFNAPQLRQLRDLDIDILTSLDGDVIGNCGSNKGPLLGSRSRLGGFRANGLGNVCVHDKRTISD